MEKRMALKEIQAQQNTTFPAKGDWLDFLLYFFCCFPFIYILPLPSDTQPYALVMSGIYIFLRRKVILPHHFKMTLIVYVIILMTYFGTMLVVSNADNMMLFRKVYNYISVMVIPVAVFNSMKRTHGLVEKWIKAFIIVWFVVGAVQSTIMPDFLGGIVSNFRTSATRGVPGLASEPSFYGYMMVFFAVLASRFSAKKERYIYIGICVFQIVFLAESSVAILYLSVFVAMICLRWALTFYRHSPSKFIKTVFLAALVATLLYFAGKVYVENNQNARLVQVFGKLIQKFGTLKTLEDVYRLDVSVGQRVNAIYTSISATIENWGLPHGFVYSDFSGRIMSGYGVAMYEFGFLGVFLIVIYSIEFYKGFKRSLPVLIGITAMMISAVQLASPMFSFALGYAVYECWKSKKLNSVI